MSQPVILAARRTPIGCFLGGLTRVPAPQLGAIVVDRGTRAFDHLIGAEAELNRLIRSAGPESSAQQLSRFVSNHELNAVIMIITTLINENFSMCFLLVTPIKINPNNNDIIAPLLPL